MRKSPEAMVLKCLILILKLSEMMMLKCLILAIKYLKIVIFSWHCLWELV